VYVAAIPTMLCSLPHVEQALSSTAREQSMFDLENFIADCRGALKESSSQSAVKEIVERAVSRTVEVVHALGTPEWAGIGTLYRSSELTILNIIWAPCMSLYPHDHRMWAVIGLYGGREDNVFYRRTARGLAQAGGKQLETTDTILLGKTVIHAVTNPLRQFTGAIHVYGGDFFAAPRREWDPVTLEERPYDIENAKRVFAEANERFRDQSAKS
jgi:predicted metal-dependent enzyme (double-stranded beta helix superfamily)